MTFPTIKELNSSSQSLFSQTIAELFEPSPRLAQVLYANRPFLSYKALLQQTKSLIKTQSHPQKLDIINAHPRIGIANLKKLSKLSLDEQGSLLNVLPELIEKFEVLNRTYEEKHGFRFVVFVNGRSREELVPVFEERLTRETSDELETGLDDMILIAYDRLKKLNQE